MGIKRKAKKKLYILALIVGFALLGILAMCMTNAAKMEMTSNDAELMQKGYIPLDKAMKLCKYKNTTNDEAKHVYTKKDSGLKIVIEFLFDENQCFKNEYQFDLAEAVIWSENLCYIKADKFKEIVNVEVTYADNQLLIKPIEYGIHEWTTAFVPVVAHAGGGYREGNQQIEYTNSLDAIIQNYNLGHRVFEIDFRLTSDQKLAAVHEWKDENGKKIKVTAKQWKEQENIFGLQYRTMLIGDVLDQMVINKDMFLITDTKTAKVGKKMNREFEWIVKEAKKRDPKLLERIIPQIYKREMYTAVTQIYPFQSIIFTLYLTKDTDSEILDFMASHDDIKVVTTWEDKRGRVDLAEPLKEYGKLVYAHTINDPEGIVAMQEKGVYGIYTDFLLPRDWQTYASTSNVSDNPPEETKQDSSQADFQEKLPSTIDDYWHLACQNTNVILYKNLSGAQGLEFELVAAFPIGTDELVVELEKSNPRVSYQVYCDQDAQEEIFPLYLYQCYQGIDWRKRGKLTKQCQESDDLGSETVQELEEMQKVYLAEYQAALAQGKLPQLYRYIVTINFNFDNFDSVEHVSAMTLTLHGKTKRYALESLVLDAEKEFNLENLSFSTTLAVYDVPIYISNDGELDIPILELKPLQPESFTVTGLSVFDEDMVPITNCTVMITKSDGTVIEKEWDCKTPIPVLAGESVSLHAICKDSKLGGIMEAMTTKSLIVKYLSADGQEYTEIMRGTYRMRQNLYDLYAVADGADVLSFYLDYYSVAPFVLEDELVT